MPAHEAAEGFPFEMEGLAEYDAIILSDIGSNTLLLPPRVWLQSQTTPNRLKLIRDWVAQGGGLLMCGGYYSFQGIDGRARWRRTAVEEALPVTCLPYDDRIEIPEGCVAEIVAPGHPVFAGMDGAWPPLLGVNEVTAKPGGRGSRTPAGRPGRPPPPRAGHARQWPRRGVDERHRPALAVAGLLRLGGLWPALEKPAGLAHRSRMNPVGSAASEILRGLARWTGQSAMMHAVRAMHLRPCDEASGGL